MVSSQDHKRAKDNDEGLNTGGMGTFSPSAAYTDALAKEAYERIFLPTVRAMEQEGRPFKGVLYFGLMMCADEIKVLEYNARFGDPETQVILPRLKNDLFDVFNAVTDGTLDQISLDWEEDACVCVCLTSGGYPESYKKGYPISFGDVDSDVVVFHAGTKVSDGVFYTNGGRVLGVTAKGATIDEARKKAYANVEKIHFTDMAYRTDIGIKKN
jgi:phosphoribosylamine--glycine ligase